MTLHSDKEKFKELIALAADHFGYEQSHIEKDYWVCKILKEIALSEHKEKVFFKGGTSLSKAYGLIERFSEDLDLFVFTGDPEASKQAEKTLNKKLFQFIKEQNADIYQERLSKIGGNYRKLFFSYDNVFQGVGLKENLEVEIKSCDLSDKKQMYYPTDVRIIKPIITVFLESIGQQNLIKEYGLSEFEIQCINPRKTICDKISRLVKLSYDDDTINLLAKHIRDIYDLCQLFDSPEYRDYLLSDEFLEAMYRVTIEDELNKNSKSNLSLADAQIFKATKKIMAKPEIIAAYNTDLKKLVFDKQKMPPIEKAINALESISQILVKFEIYRNNL
jgi:predicted nucleotidyltransferase component of viral defense system